MKLASFLLVLILFFVGCDLFDSDSDTASDTGDTTPLSSALDSLGGNDSLGTVDSSGTVIPGDTALGDDVPVDTAKSADSVGAPIDSSNTGTNSGTTPDDIPSQSVDSNTAVTPGGDTPESALCDSLDMIADSAKTWATLFDLYDKCIPDSVPQADIDADIIMICGMIFDGILYDINYETVFWSETCYGNESAECMGRKQVILDDIEVYKQECVFDQTHADSLAMVLPMYTDVTDYGPVCDSITTDAEWYMEGMFKDHTDECLYVTPQCSTYMAPLTQYEADIKKSCPERNPSFDRFTENDVTIVLDENTAGLYPQACDANGDSATTKEEIESCYIDKSTYHECDYNLDDLLDPVERKECMLQGDMAHCDTSDDGILDLAEMLVCVTESDCGPMKYYHATQGTCVHDTRPEVAKLRDSLSVECNTLLDDWLAGKDSAAFYYADKNCNMDELKYTMPTVDSTCTQLYTDHYTAIDYFNRNSCEWFDAGSSVECINSGQLILNTSDDFRSAGCVEQAQVTLPYWGFPLIYPL